MKSWHISSDGKACVSDTIQWLKVDQNTPRNIKVLLINENDKQPYVGTVEQNRGATHWCPMPKFGE